MERIAIITTNNELIEMHNLARSKFMFEIDPSEFYKVAEKVKSILHTHEGECKPSNLDVLGMYLWRVPWIIKGKDCIEGYLFDPSFGVLEIDIDSLIPKELYDLIMKLF
ncbi:hypothetical protein Saci_1501 [Sulfolobus acidocaldarius DSM 639]|uniref:Uncharacterized protein n=4 Tax=Sulfolobus acidocaldarius TaxID=2285 RepID=Q4J8Q9_SULAC|nr:hypothetical protein Saci_1501 [Sulfolobus acidocaldarius DSM 639]